jgi:mono/diheme cytochrome c family protein
MKLKTEMAHNSATGIALVRWVLRPSRLVLLLTTCLLLAGGCRQDMQDQPRFKPLRPNPMFDDGGSARPLVEGTVSRGSASFRPSWSAASAKPTPILEVNDPSQATQFPFPVTANVLDRGQDRFNIYCAVCHGRIGDGRGMVVQRGFRQPPSYHVDRLRAAPIGHFYDVMTKGFGAMPSYGEQVTPQDRWAIIAYIRALQLSQHAPVSDVPLEKRGKLSEGGPLK